MNSSFEFLSTQLSLGMALTYIPLFLGILVLPKLGLKVALSFAGFSAGMALVSGLISVVALPGIVALALACYAFTQYQRYLWLSGSVIFALTVAVFIHKLPGFNNPIILEPLRLAENSIPYQLYLNFDKAILGLVLLSFMRQNVPLNEGARLLPLLAVSLTVSIVAFIIAIVGGLVAWSPKWFDWFVIWSLSNLFITCVAEEAFFRGFIQRLLQQKLAKANKSGIVAVVITALLFGLVHIAGGWLYMLLAGLMGFGYGYVFYKTGQLRWAIGFHFVFNLLHIVFFSYPMLARLG